EPIASNCANGYEIHGGNRPSLIADFLKTLPIGQVRNGTVEIMKISHCSEKRTWDLPVKYGPHQLVESGYGRKENGSPELKNVADEVCRCSIWRMLELECGNLREIGLDRVIANGHGISPTLELAPFPPLRHGHAITVDMSYTVVLSHARDNELLHRSVEAIKKTRDGLQRFVLPGPKGYVNCVVANDTSEKELEATLAELKSYVKKRFPEYPGHGQDAFADADDLCADPAKILANKIAKGEYPSPTDKLQAKQSGVYLGPENAFTDGESSNPLKDREQGRVALVNGGRMQKSLYVVRALARQRYRVVFVEERGWGELCATRFSNAVSRFRLVPSGGGQDYVDALLMRERLGGGINTLIQDTHLAETLHEKDRFIDLVHDLGLEAPQSRIVRSPEEALNYLRQQEVSKGGVLLKAATVLDDVGRADMTTYPLHDARTNDVDWEQTEERVRRRLAFRISNATPFPAQEFIGGPGASEWCSHVTVWDGELVAFVCSPSNDMLMTYHNATETPIGQQALQWTQEFLRRLRKNPRWANARLTGQFSMDFIHQPALDRLVVIECNPRVHTAVCLLQDQSAFGLALAGKSSAMVTPSSTLTSISWLGHDLVGRYLFHLLPASLVKRVYGPSAGLSAKSSAWKDACTDAKRSITWPALLLRQSFFRRKPFSRINVSTARIFECNWDLVSVLTSDWNDLLSSPRPSERA
ncbi:unnamed protein product, partial [Tilletia controversa]